MRIKIKEYNIEGSPEEVVKLLSLLATPKDDYWTRKIDSEIREIERKGRELAKSGVLPKKRTRRAITYTKSKPQCKGVTVAERRRCSSKRLSPASDFCYIHSPETKPRCATKGQYYNASE